MSEGSSSQTGPVKQTLLLLMAIMICIYVAKVFLRSPEHRAQEVCYLPYLIVEFAIVDVWGAVVANDPVSYLKHARYAANFHSNCMALTSKWGFLQHLSKNPMHHEQ